MIRKVDRVEMPHASSFTEGWCLVDIETEGRFWRTSKLLTVHVIEYGDPCTELSLYAERESDEYDMLSELSQVLMRASNIMTFNGNSFDLPHLRKKYQAYRASDPTNGRNSLDLMRALAPYQFLFDMQSHHLSDYLTLFSGRYGVRNDAEGAFLVSSLLDLRRIFTAAPSSLSACYETSPVSGKKMLTASWHMDAPLPVDIDHRDEVFRLFSREGIANLEIETDGEMLRRYYTDYENYEFLLSEGYAAHRSLTSYVAEDRKEKAVRENCFMPVPVASVFPDRPDRLCTYIQSALDYLRRNIP